MLLLWGKKVANLKLANSPGKPKSVKLLLPKISVCSVGKSAYVYGHNITKQRLYNTDLTRK